MGRKKNKKNIFASILFSLVRGIKTVVKKLVEFVLSIPNQIKRYALAFLMFLLAVIIALSFFDLSGQGGRALHNLLFQDFGHAFFISPFLFALFGFIFLFIPRRYLLLSLFGSLLLIFSLSGFLKILDTPAVSGGRMGELEARPVERFFGEVVSFFIFLGAFFVLGLSIWHIFELSLLEEEERKSIKEKVRGLFSPSDFKVLEVEPKKTSPKKRRRKGKKEEKEKEVEKKTRKSGFKASLPPLDLLEVRKKKPHSRNLKEGAKTIEKTFENFDIDVKMVGADVGPTVTQYTLRPPKGVRLSKITGLSNNLALALAAHPVRIEAPIPGKSLVGVEVPNKKRGIVRLRDLLSHSKLKGGQTGLGFPLGEDVAGKPIFSDLSRLPHILVAGATGTGKTVFLNSLILSLLYQRVPEELRLIMVDPKKVEFASYSHLPHLLCPVVSESDKTVGVLAWLVEEMERRFSKLSTNGSRNVYSYNKKIDKKGGRRMPYIVLIIDELADIMVAQGKELEEKIVRVAQKARAVGIHLVVATQRPSVEVITGLIKANITSRVSFQLPTQVDSRTVLDMAGAEKLLGAGDMLFVSPRRVKPRRIQSPYVSESEVEKVTTWIENENAEKEAELDELSERLDAFIEETQGGVEVIDGMEKDPLYEKARDLVLQAGKGSASLLQRRLRIGYVRAARILDMMEAEGVVGTSRDGKARKVLVDEGDFGEEDLEEEDMDNNFDEE